MAYPNLSVIKEMNHKVNEDINKVVTRYDGSEDTNTKKLLEQVVDSLAIMTKELDYAFRNLGMENMPTVGSVINNKIQGLQIEIDGEMKNLKDLIDEKTGEIAKDVLDKVKEINISISNIKQDVGEITTTVQSQTIELNDTTKKVIEQNKDIDKLGSELVASGKVIETHTSKIEQLAKNINLKVSKTDYTGREVMSMINLDSSSIKIKSDKLELEGQTTLSTPDGMAKLHLENRWGVPGLEFSVKMPDGGYSRAFALSFHENRYDRFTTIELPYVRLEGRVDRRDLREITIDV